MFQADDATSTEVAGWKSACCVQAIAKEQSGWSQLSKRKSGGT